MKLLTLAVAIALLGTFFLGCDESKTMMEEVTRETPPMTPAEPTPAEPRGEVTVQETVGASSWSNVGISYTNAPNEDGTGQLTIYFEIPDAIGDGPHSVTVMYIHKWLQTNLPNQQLIEEGEYTEEGSDRRTYAPYDLIIATVSLDLNNKIVIGYKTKENALLPPLFEIYETRDVDAPHEYLFDESLDGISLH